MFPYLSVGINIVDIESETQFITYITIRIHVDREQKFDEVNETIPVHVERAEHLRTILLRFVLGIELLVDFRELSRRELAGRAIAKKGIVPLMDLLGGIVRVFRQTINRFVV